MRRLTQCALLGAVVLLSGLLLDGMDAPPADAGPSRASLCPADGMPANAMTSGDVRAFLERHGIPHQGQDLRGLTDRVNAAAQRYGLDPALVLAVIRVESTFRPEVVSNRGAVGLMQILPDTGEALAAEIGFPWDGEHRLLDPAVNIELGAYYLRKLLDRFDGDPEAALEAYNMGPSRLASLKRHRASVPFVYAKRVLPVFEELR